MFRLVLTTAAMVFAMSTAAISEKVSAIALTPDFSIARTIEDNGRQTISYFGTMTPMGMAVAISEIKKGTYDNLEMNSPGGHAKSGYALGKTVKEFNLVFTVKKNQVCVSACAFAALSASQLNIQGILSFHLPYIPMASAEMSFHQYGQITVAANVILIKYILESGYNLQFVDLLVYNTEREVFVSFLKSEDLYEFKQPPLTDVEKVDTLYVIHTKQDLKDYLMKKEEDE